MTNLQRTEAARVVLNLSSKSKNNQMCSKATWTSKIEKIVVGNFLQITWEQEAKTCT